MSTAQMIESACLTLQHTTDVGDRNKADQYLLSLRDSPKPFPLCLSVLQSSAHEAVQYQMLAIIKYSVLKKWSMMTALEIDTLTSDILVFGKNHAPTLKRFVLIQLLHVVAVLLKRDWMTDEAKSCTKVLYLLDSLMVLEQPQQHSMAMLLCTALLREFSSSKSTEIGLSLEFHASCLYSFQSHCLKPIFTKAVQLLEATQSATGGLLYALSALIASAGVINAVLNWEFVILPPAFQGSLPAEAVHQLFKERVRSSIDPGENWTAPLVESTLLDIFFVVYQQLYVLKGKQQVGVEGDVEVAMSGVQECLVQMSSFQGSIFPPSRPEVYTQYTQRLANRVGQFASDVMRCEPVFLEGIQLLSLLFQRIMGNLQLRSLYLLRFDMTASSSANDGHKSMTGAHGGNSLLALIAAFSRYLLRASGKSTYGPEVASMLSASFDTLLEGWISLLSTVANQTFSGLKGAQAEKLGPGELKDVEAAVRDWCGGIFSHYVERQLSYACWEATDGVSLDEQFTDVDYQKDHLPAIAQLARGSMLQALGLLDQHLKQRCATLHGLSQCTTTVDEAALSLCKEELYWLFLMATHVLTDDITGETPLIPDVCLRISLQAHAHGQVDPLVTLSQTMFTFVEYESQMLPLAKMKLLLSPLLAELLVTFLERWVVTYLFPSEAHHSMTSPSLWGAYGQNTEGGNRVLDAVLRKVCQNLQLWPEEWQLAEKSASLIASLVESKKVRTALSKCSSWWAVIEQFVKAVHDCQQKMQQGGSGATKGEASFLFALDPKTVISLTRTLAQGVGEFSYADEKDRQIHFAQFVAPLQTGLSFLAENCKSTQLSNSPVFIDLLRMYLDLLRGVGTASGAKVFPLSYALISNYFPFLLELVALFGSKHANIVLSVIETFRDIAEADVVFLSAEMFGEFTSCCLSLVHAYGLYNSGRLIALKSASAAAASTEEQFNDIHAMLTLLSHLLSLIIDMADTANPSTLEQGAQALFLMLSYLLPNINECLLLYPEVVQTYFETMKLLISNFPDKFMQLPEDARLSMYRTIEFSISHHVSSVAEAGFRTLETLALFEISCNETAFLDSQVAGGAALANTNKLILVQFQRVVFRLLMHETVACSLDTVASALLPLILSSPSAHAEIVTELVQQFAAQDESAAAERLRVVFQALQGNGLTQELSRANVKKFTRNLHEFVLSVQAFVKYR